MVSNSSPTVEVSREGNQWTITFKVAVKTNKIVFTIGQEFIEASPISDKSQKVTKISHKYRRTEIV